MNRLKSLVCTRNRNTKKSGREVGRLGTLHRNPNRNGVPKRNESRTILVIYPGYLRVLLWPRNCAGRHQKLRRLEISADICCAIGGLCALEISRKNLYRVHDSSPQIVGMACCCWVGSRLPFDANIEEQRNLLHRR